MNAVLELALMECGAQVIASIHNLPIDPRDVTRFVELFRRDFSNALKMGGNPADVWLRDRPRVTTLARAIGAFAEFLAIADPAKPGAVGFDHLIGSYRVLGPQCHRELKILRQYCETVPLTLDGLNDARPDGY
jgi:hypothetical protein